MTEVAGVVVTVRDGQAIVHCHAEPAGCALCGGGRGCSWRRVVGTRSLAVPAANDLYVLSPGDAVTLSVDDATLLMAAARLYLPPLAGLLLGPAVLQVAGFDGGLSVAAAVVGLAFGCILARQWARQTPAVSVRRQAPAT